MRIERDQIKTLAVFGVLAGAFVIFLWMPRHAAESHQRQRIEQYQKQLGINQPNTQGLGELNQQVAELRLTVNQAQRYVPQDTELADLLAALTNQFKVNQIAEHEVQTRAIEKGKDYNVIPLTIRCQASFLSIFGFVSQIESMPRLVRINRLALSGEPYRTSPRLTVRLELDTFSSSVEEK